ncbi:hypothetical protein V5O48_001492 [Marasmius crinis-equi]|uniref:Uncharacterized protein n=1 Tax=Marasmius crinis-equi TaxID=585013 RepID=A0ABR3FY86_9AGAR
MSDSAYVEQDRSRGTGDDDLPTYDDLVAQNGPNSRFGRWRGWIEKRAAERYYDITPEERERRRQRGWGNDEMYLPEAEQTVQLNVPIITNQPPTPGPASTLTIQTSNLSLSEASSYSASQRNSQQAPSSQPLPPLPPVSNQLRPTHLKMHSFGSRFLPHAKSPIRCLLPLVGDRLLLIGHDEGLSVLDMFPREWTGSGGVSLKGPEEAQAFPIWQGESVLQMSLLEVEDAGEGTPQGVVLLLVGPEPDSPSGKDNEALKVLRMYNLASLTSLAKVLYTKGSRPLDMRRPSNWNAQQTPTKRHRPSNSITRGLKSLIESPNNNISKVEEHTSSYQALLTPTNSTGTFASGSNARSPSPKRVDSEESWDVIDDLPLRWATDFVPLASPGSRLSSLSVLSYALWSGDVRSTGRGGRMLAIATKANILLYEAPKGERAFHFVKEFYTPLIPRSITFFQQAVAEVSRSLSDAGPRQHQPASRRDSTATVRETRHSQVLSPTRGTYGPQLSVFVIFDKRSGWIRLADAAVGELELQDDTALYGLSRELTSSSSHRKSRLSSSFDPPQHAGKWIAPTLCDLPMQTANGQIKKIMLLTRGKKTHILPYPLPVSLSPCPPYLIITWKNTPSTITPRVCEPPDDSSAPPFLQVIALGEMGIEAQERPFSFLGGGGKGKGKARALADEVMHVEEDTGGDSGFLCHGGHWDQPHFAMQAAQFNAGLSRSYSTDSYATTYSSLESEELMNRMEREQGMYCWCRKGVGDYRVFWLGGVHVVEYGEEALEDEYHGAI